MAAAVIAAAPIGVAHAGYLETTFTGGMTTQVAEATVYDFDNGKPSSYTGEGWTLNKSVPGYAAAPAGDTTPYLSVAFPESAGSETFTAAPGTSYNYFGLYWGSIDDYNSIEFFLGNTSLGKFTGLNVIQTGTALGDQVSAGSNRYVNFWFRDELEFDRVVFNTTNFAFESDNHAYARVPEPGTFALMGAGFAAFAFMRRRRRES
jgi:hypothetical protein